MGVKAFISGARRWLGKPLVVTTYAYSEDSTPIDPSDTFGGTPQLSATLISVPGDKYWRNRDIEIRDSTRGRAVGIARTPAGNGLQTTLQADGRTALMNVTKSANNYVGTLSGAINYYMGLVGITTNIVVDSSAGQRSVVLPGWEANVFDMVRMLLVINKLEMTEIGDKIVIRNLRQREMLRLRDSEAPQWSIDSSSIAKQVEGYYYNNVQRTGALAYPPGGWNNDVQVYQVDAGQTIQFDLQVNAYLTSVVQPRPSPSVSSTYTQDSVYSITGNDGLVILPAQWTAGGGRLTVEILPDRRTLRVTLTAMNSSQYAPYRVAMPTGPSNVYSSLRIIGTGIFFTEKQELIWTGANEKFAVQDVGASVKNPFISTLAQLYDTMIWATARWAGPVMKLTMKSSGIQRRGERNNYRYPTIREFNGAMAGKTIAEFNAIYAGKTIADFNAEWNATVADEFVNQAFGNMAGARLLDDGQWYRVRSSDDDEDYSMTLEKDTTIRDFNARYAGMTIAQFNTFWAGRSLADFAVRPLREGA